MKNTYCVLVYGARPSFDGTERGMKARIDWGTGVAPVYVGPNLSEVCLMREVASVISREEDREDFTHAASKLF